MSLRSATKALQRTLHGIDTCLTWSQDPTSCGASVASVSRWSVLAQLEHLALADEAILQFLMPADPGERPTDNRGRPKLIGYVVLSSGHIPRGKGRAPEFTVPRDISRADVAACFETLRERYGALRATLPALAQSKSSQPHPALGHFTPTQWLRFVDIHHRHHAAIIREILAQSDLKR